MSNLSLSPKELCEQLLAEAYGYEKANIKSPSEEQMYTNGTYLVWSVGRIFCDTKEGRVWVSMVSGASPDDAKYHYYDTIEEALQR